MPEFVWAIRYEIVYWTDQEALCLNFLTNVKPISFKLTTNNRFGQCSKTVIKCLDNWETWTKLDAKWLESCRQSSGTEYKLWEYKPIEKEEERYWFGDKTYTPNYCWPGPSPIYSPLMQYPDNIFLAINTLYTQIADFVEDIVLTSVAGALAKAGVFPEALKALGSIAASGPKSAAEARQGKIKGNNK